VPIDIAHDYVSLQKVSANYFLMTINYLNFTDDVREQSLPFIRSL